MRRYLFPVITLLFATFLTLAPLFRVDWYPMHDSTHPMRLSLLQETVSGGQFPPVWANRINSGYGYPLFHLYAPLYHYTSYFFSFMLSNPLALKATLALYTFLGLLGIWQITKRWGTAASLLATFSLALSPYLALDLYVRGAYAEYLSLCLLPWVFYTLSHLLSPRRALLAAFVTSLFLLSHNLIPILVAPLLLLYLLFLKPPLKLVALYGLTTCLLSAWFVLPLVFERGFTQAESIAQTTVYNLHFVEPWQIWNSTWGFGGSAPGVEDGMSFKLGKLQLLLAAFGILLALVRRRLLGILVAGALLYSLVLATPYSAWFWQNLPLLPLVQFPWRALGLAVILLSILGAYSLTIFRSQTLRLLFSLVLSVGLILLNLKYFVPQTTLSYPTEFVDIAQVVPEYLPRWMPNWPLRAAEPSEVAYYPTWEARVGETLLPTYPDESGVLRYNAPAGSEVTLTQSHTLLQRVSYVLTLGTTCLILILFVLKRL